MLYSTNWFSCKCNERFYNQPWVGKTLNEEREKMVINQNAKPITCLVQFVHRFTKFFSYYLAFLYFLLLCMASYIFLSRRFFTLLPYLGTLGFYSQVLYFSHINLPSIHVKFLCFIFVVYKNELSELFSLRVYKILHLSFANEKNKTKKILYHNKLILLEPN